MGKLGIGLIVITGNKDVFFLLSIFGTIFVFLISWFYYSRSRWGFFFPFSFICVLLTCVLKSHELKKKKNLSYYFFTFSLLFLFELDIH